jgi:Xaa-Pro aminopeptidase
MTNAPIEFPQAPFARAPRRLANVDRARRVMADLKLDAIIGTNYKNLYYLSGHMPDSVVGHFADVTAAAILPATEHAPACLCASDYDLAYLVTRPTWMPELRMFSAKTRSSAAYLLEMIQKGTGIDTELRHPLRRVFAETREMSENDLYDAIAAYVRKHLGKGKLRIGFDDLRVAAVVREKIGDRLEIHDALHTFRAIRIVKTQDELDLLRRASAINDRATLEAAAATREGAPIFAMVDAYRLSVVRQGGKFLGERGMMFGAGPDGGFVLDNGWAETRRLKRGDTIVYDAIGTYQLYHMDIARTGYVGEPPVALRRAHSAVREALETAESMLKPGVHTSLARDRAAEIIGKHGYDPSLTTMMFHSIGLDVLEYADPADKARGWTVEKDMALNFEVFYRDPDLGGVHLEDTVFVGDGGIEHLTTLPREIIVTERAEAAE